MSITKRTTTKHYVRWESEAESIREIVSAYDGAVARVVSLSVEYVWREETQDWRAWHNLKVRKVRKDGELFANENQSFASAPWIKEFVTEHMPDWHPSQGGTEVPPR
jgi:hypothetical protein